MGRFKCSICVAKADRFELEAARTMLRVTMAINTGVAKTKIVDASQPK